MPLRCVARGVRSALASKAIHAYFNRTFSWMCTVVLPYYIQLPLICNTRILMLTCVIINNSCTVWMEQNLFSWNSTVLNHNVFEPKWQEQTLQNRQWCISHTWHSYVWSGSHFLSLEAVSDHTLSVHPHGTTQLPPEKFPWNFIFEYFSNICQGSSSLIKILQK